MPSRKQLIVASLKDMSRRCVKAQIHLAAIRAARRSIEADEALTLAQIRQIRARIDRELQVSGSELGITPADVTPDDE